MTDKKQDLSVEQKVGHYAGVLHSLTHARAETPEHCKAACEALDNSITQIGKLLSVLVSGELPQAH